MTSQTIAQYERAFSKAVNAPFAYAFWKGRVALYAILKALDIGLGDEVIVPAFTCVVVPNAVRSAGATPVYADIAPGSYNVSAEAVAQCITPRTRAILAQHTFGIPAEMRALQALARDFQIAVIEDCAHALGSTSDGQPVGTFGSAAFFSSQWSKPYTTGLGGMAVTADPTIAQRLQRIQASFAAPARTQQIQLRVQYELYRRFFSPQSYWAAMGALQRLSRWGLFVGSSSTPEMDGSAPVDTTWRMADAQARAGFQQLDRLPQSIAHRQQIAAFYEQRLRQHGAAHELDDGVQPVYVRYPVRVENKQTLLQRAAEHRIELGSWFETVLHPVDQALDRFGYRVGQCPVAEETARQVVNLPLHQRVTADEAERILSFIERQVVFAGPVHLAEQQVQA